VDFQVGEKVVYPSHGVGVVESIQSRSTPTGRVSGYDLRILSNDSRVFVPHESARGIGLRPMISVADAERILTALGDGVIDQSANWKGRFKENSDRMRTGSLFDVANVLKGLTSISRRKVLSFREKRMLERARFLIVSELAEVEGRSHSDLELLVDGALERTLRDEPRPARQKPVARARPSNA
jgi:CarD family transcriptional regulator, regulator of rRNA transcription